MEPRRVTYKETNSFAARCDEARAMTAKYPSRVPIVLEPETIRTPSLDKRKFLAPPTITFGQLTFVVRQRINLRPDQALFFFFVDNTLVPSTATISEVYAAHRDADGFLYLFYSLENAFGSDSR